MKKKLLGLTTIIALMFITFMCKPVEAAYESAPVNNLIKKGVEFYNSDNEKITTLQMENGETETITAKIKFEYSAPTEGTVSNMPIRFYISSSSTDIELIPTENGTLDGGAISGYNTDHEVLYDGGNHTDCYVYQTFKVKANANVNDATIDLFVNVNMEGIEYSEGLYSLPVFAIDPEKLTDYTVDGDEGNSISFVNEEGRVFYFNSFDYTAVTDAYIQEMVDNSNGIYTFEDLKNSLDFILENAKNAVNGMGDIIKVYEFSLCDEAAVEIHNAPNGFKIKLKITDDMKGYDTYSLFYINYDGTTEDAIKLTKNGEYLEGTLPHLSTYALVGNKNGTSDLAETTEETAEETETTEQDNTLVEETTKEATKVSKKISNSPKTGDSVAIWVSLIAVSTFVVAGLFVYTRKN